MYRNVAPAADVENRRSEREETVCPPAVEEKTQPVVSSSVSSHITATRNTPAVNNPAPPRPPPDRTEEEDNDYDSDDASMIDFSSGLQNVTLHTPDVYFFIHFYHFE